LEKRILRGKMIATKIILIPIIGAIIGLITNWIAVKMLFHPKNKIFGIQGLIPKRKKDLAKRLGEASTEILPKTIDKIKKIRFVGDIVYSKLMDYFKQDVEKKIKSLNNDEIEKIVMQIAKKELNFIVWIGAIVGFLIGCIQVWIMLI